MKNKINDLRDHLFATLDALRDPNAPMDIERARAIAQVAQVIVNSATAEVKFIQATGGKGSGFVPDEPAELPDARSRPKVITHRLV